MAPGRDDKFAGEAAVIARPRWRACFSQYANPIAVGVSLLLHAGVVYVGRSTAEHVADMPVQEAEVRSAVYLEREPEPKQPDVPEPEPLLPHPKVLEPEQVKAVEPPPVMQLRPIAIAPTELIAAPPPAVPQRSDGFGEITGTAGATALHSLDGDQPMQARQGERDQAPLDRITQEQVPEAPAQADAAPQVEVVEKDAHVEEAERVPERREIAKEDPVEPKPPSPTDPTVPGDAQPMELAMRETPAVEPQSEAKADVLSVSRPEQRSRTPESPQRPGANATSDSDAFSTQGATEFRPGKVTAAFGRRVKTVRPRLTLAGQYDLLGMAVPKVALDLRVDETGRVRHVSIAQSSGSTQIDEACELAMYEWWFEPPRNSDGLAVACELRWTISFRH